MGFASVAAIVAAIAVLSLLLPTTGSAADSARVAAYSRQPALEQPAAARFRFGGFIGERLKANHDNWLLTAPFANPAMIEMFRDRDRAPYRDLLPWSGEFVGKYLTAAVLNWRITRDPALKRVIDTVVADFIATQSPEGYLGPFPREQRLLVGWDVWGHYHALVGLLLHFDTTGDERALAAARKAADFVCDTFPEGGSEPGESAGRRVVSVGSEEMNEAIIHGMLLLYEHTSEKRYLDLARRVEQDWETPPSGDYVRTALAGVPFYQTPKPRWESLHDLQAIAELYLITGDAKYRRALEHIWWSMVETDRHNTGAFSSNEQACGNPYHTGPIETCCNVAWIALSLDMLRVTGLPLVADEIELATFNGGIGGQSPSGRWWTYNTPMEGHKKASAHDINFQCRPGSPELNCCSVNGPRVLGMLAQWSLMRAADGLALNYYGPCELSAELPSGERVTLRQETTYPRQGEVKITMGLASPRRFALRLRIPYWSARTTVKVNNATLRSSQAPCSAGFRLRGRRSSASADEGVVAQLRRAKEPSLRSTSQQIPATPGSYLVLDRAWKNGDRIDLTLDMSLHFWVGEKDSEGKTSIFRGPILLAYDPRFNETDFDKVAPLPAADMKPEIVAWEQGPTPWLLLRFKTADGAPLLLCDFATAGMTGTEYHSWLRVAKSPVATATAAFRPSR